MKVINDTKRKACYFMDVSQGQVFFYDDRYAIAINPVPYTDDTDGINAVFLDDGNTIWLDAYETVIIGFDAALTIN